MAKQTKQKTSALDFERGQDSCGVAAVVQIKKRALRGTVTRALNALTALSHRAGRDAGGDTGDGAGLMSDLPHGLFATFFLEKGLPVPMPGDYAVGMLFLPAREPLAAAAQEAFARALNQQGLPTLFFRDVPVDERAAGALARSTMPRVCQAFVGRPENVARGLDFERALFFARRAFEKSGTGAYVCSLSAERVVYKGLLTPEYLAAFYPDLQSPLYRARFALVHARFSTNTAPAWARAHPCRLIAHNGEINTIRGNADRMLARENVLLRAPVFCEHADILSPVIDQSGSDSAILDNALELLFMGGVPLPEAVMMALPPALDGGEEESVRQMYLAFASRMEPWDGPAALLFAAGGYFGAALDRNGLRPLRYFLTKTDELILSSEAGAPALNEEEVADKGRLSEGGILLCDLENERVLFDAQAKRVFSQSAPFARLNKARVSLGGTDAAKPPCALAQEDRERLCAALGYTNEDALSIRSLALSGQERIASMGASHPLAALSASHRPLYDFFFQRFAQVTNPPIDSLREACMTDTAVFLGKEGDPLMNAPCDAPTVWLSSPVIDEQTLARVKTLNEPDLNAHALTLLYPPEKPLEEAVAALLQAADESVAAGHNILILSDRGVCAQRAAIPSLLAVSALEQHLIARRLRTDVSVVAETGDARDAHQLAALVGFGARAVCPYLARACARAAGENASEAARAFDGALTRGLVKIAAKMGISSLRAYQSAQLFEIVGLSEATVARYFTNTPCEVGGRALDDIARDVRFFHARAFFPSSAAKEPEDARLTTPALAAMLRQAVLENDYALYEKFAAQATEGERLTTLRGQLEFRESVPIPLCEVEPEERILERFETGAMSYGSISASAHVCVARAMNALGALSNSGEGGEDASRALCGSASGIRQVASGRFGVSGEYILGAREIQIKMAQGAKPGEGGHLPGKKVSPEIASARLSTPGVALISPPPHHDIYSIEDLAQLIYDLKMAGAGVPVSVKLASGTGVGTIAAGVVKAGANGVTISGFDGGTGAAPVSSLEHAGLPWELGLRRAHAELCENKLRARAALCVDGKLLTGRDVLIASALGADRFSFATLPLLALGCVMCRCCHTGKCPAGIATQDPALCARFAGEPEHVMRLMRFVARQTREMMAALGVRKLDDLIGHAELLKASGGRLSPCDVSCLTRPAAAARFENAQPSPHMRSLDARLISYLYGALDAGTPVSAQVKVGNTDRAVGAYLSAYITRRHDVPLADGTVHIDCTGAGGQSFGAFLCQGVTLSLLGDSNDYLGKGLCGGRLIQRAQNGAPGLTGNVALYGATKGEAFLCALAGERFAVRNSGAVTVVEGAGAHALEYMTGGEALILGPVGRNFAAGMSGGVAYLAQADDALKQSLSENGLLVLPLGDTEAARVRELLKTHAALTGSLRARELLRDFEKQRLMFSMVVPALYAAIRADIARGTAEGLTNREAERAAFARACVRGGEGV